MGRFGLATVLFLLAVGPALAGDPELVNGQPQQLEASTGVTFWTTKNPYSPVALGPRKYRLLDAGKERLLLEGARIEAPTGFRVTQASLDVRLEDASFSYRMGRTETTIKYKQYRITGRWTVVAPQDCAEGEYDIKIHLPAVALARAALKAESPSGETSITLRVKTYRTARARSLARWQGNLWKGLGCLVGMTVCLAGVGFCIWGLFYAGSFHALLLGGMFAFPGWFCSLGYFDCTGRALSDLHQLHPMYAVAAGLGINVGYFLLFWLVSGFGRWNRIWAQCLGLGVLLLLAVTGAVFALRPELPFVAQGRQVLPYAMPAILPGLALATLAAALRKPVPAATAAEPQDEAGLADVQEHLRRLTAGSR
jgi:hypothetical protein